MTPWPSTFLRNLIGPMSKPNQLNDFFRVVKQSVISFIGSDNHVQRKNTLMNQFLFFFLLDATKDETMLEWYVRRFS